MEATSSDYFIGEVLFRIVLHLMLQSVQANGKAPTPSLLYLHPPLLPFSVITSQYPYTPPPRSKAYISTPDNVRPSLPVETNLFAGLEGEDVASWSRNVTNKILLHW